MVRKLRAVVCLAIALTAAPIAATTALAHPLSPALLTVRELGDGTIEVLWKTSATRLRGAEFAPDLPDGCHPLEMLEASEEGGSLRQRWREDCGAGGLVGRQIGVEGLVSAGIDVLVRVQLQDGRVVQTVLHDTDPYYTIPERTSRQAVLRSYGALGTEHILTGFDHLLFVFGLLLLVDGIRPLVKTITAFTLGHSVTLSFTVLGFVHFPSSLIEVAIAASIFVLAAELAYEESGNDTWIHRYPWTIALLFGLLHGAGFAGALAAVGLPDGEIPLALFSFNLGIEVGQLLFIAVVLLLQRAFGRLLAILPHWTEWIPIYGLGSLSAYWCFERTFQLFR